MKKEFFKLNGIPCVLWGEKSKKIIIAVHGNMSNKEDTPIKILAETGTKKGWQVLSFDLAEHGERKNSKVPCKIQNSVKDLEKIFEYVEKRYKDISIFGNSIGAYFTLTAYKNKKIEKVFFLSPVVDMKKIIESMMKQFNISEEELCRKKVADTPINQKIYWDYYCYVKENPIDKWNTATYILYGENDEICRKEDLLKFSEKFSCTVKIAEECGHYFHREKEIEIYKNWLEENL